MRFSARAVTDRVRALRQVRALDKRDRARAKQARELWALLDQEGLFEPLNRAERRLWDKLCRRGLLNQWYARRLHQLDRGWMIPYLPELIADRATRRALEQEA